MDEIDWGKLEERRVHGRLPDNYSVYKSNLGKDWDEAIKRRQSVDPDKVELDIEVTQSQSGTLDKYEFPKGILAPEKFWAGLQDEMERVNRKLGV